MATRRKTAAGEHPASEDARARARTKQEFAEAEAHEAEWHERDKERYHQERLPQSAGCARGPYRRIVAWGERDGCASVRGMSPDPFEVDTALPRNNHVVLHEGTVELLDGGSAAWCEWGDPRGRPVFFLHGTPGSRLFLPDAKQRLGSGARVLTVDRPGYGRSTSLAIPSLAAVAEIVAAVADVLGLDRFPVVGFSGGGPFALACGAFLPERVSRVAMVSSWGPLDELEVAYANLTPTERELVAAIRADPAGATALLWESGAWYAERPLRFLETPHEAADEPILRESTIRANFSASNLEGARQGQAGLVSDWVADALPWGFRLADVSVPVDLWIGERDPGRAPIDAYELERRLPSAAVYADTEAGHWLLIPRWAEIVAQSLCH